MGMFDSVFVDCPECGETTELQSKAGWCILSEFTLDDVPPSIAGDLNGEKLGCDCGYRMKVKVIPSVVKYIKVEKEEDED